MIRTIIFATAIAGTATTAIAEVGIVPSPANPFPANPIATDGSPLPRNNGTHNRAVTIDRNGVLSFFNGGYDASTARAR